MSERLRAIGVVLVTAFRADPRRAIAVAALSLANALIFATMPLWLKLLADNAVAGDAYGALLAAGAATASITVAVFGGWIGTNAEQMLQERTNLLIDERLARLALDVPGLEHFERPDYANELALLREERGLLGQSLEAIMMSLQALVLYSMAVVLLASVHPVLLLLPAFGFAFLITGKMANKFRQEAMEATAEPSRSVEHLFDLATRAEAGKELRIFGLGGEILERHDRLWRQVDWTRTRASMLEALLSAVGWLLFTLGYAGAIVFVVWLAVRGGATPGDVLMTLGLAADVHRYVGNAEYLFRWLLSALNAVRRYLWLMDYAAAARPALADPVSVPRRLTHGLDFEHVSFRYPGTKVEVLSGITLHVPAGSVVALVGENGAGKTTLAKLLCRLYEPTAGRIAVEGVDLRNFEIDAWRRRLSAGFQDFARFELLVREAVGVGDLAHIEDPPAVEAALARAGAEDLPARLPAGLETRLGREWEGGVELSGGQWQKLGLGRAMMREQPLLLILDEPTASLDAQTEHLLFERYAQAARQAVTETGTITVLVSHRFSTVRMADLIVALEGRRVREWGSHEELMAAGGLYAELYELQARAYR